MLWALAILVVVTALARRATGHPAISRLGALVPAWRFFDRAVRSPYLMIRWAAPGGGFGAWSPIAYGPRGALSWAFAPRANLALAEHAALERLVGELGELELAAPTGPDEIETDPAIVERISYAIVGRIAGGHVPAALRAQPGARFQWKLFVPAADDSLVSVELAA